MKEITSPAMETFTIVPTEISISPFEVWVGTISDIINYSFSSYPDSLVKSSNSLILIRILFLETSKGWLKTIWICIFLFSILTIAKVKFGVPLSENRGII
jgi:hypothetical protein